MGKFNLCGGIRARGKVSEALPEPPSAPTTRQGQQKVRPVSLYSQTLSASQQTLPRATTETGSVPVSVFHVQVQRPRQTNNRLIKLPIQPLRKPKPMWVCKSRDAGEYGDNTWITKR